MADQNSTQYALQLSDTAGGQRVSSRDYGEHLIYVDHTPSTAMSADDTLNLIRLDTGATRILMPYWYAKRGAFGAGRTLDFGHRAYRQPDGTVVAENLTAFGTAYNVTAAGEGFLSPDLTNPIFTALFNAQVVLTATVRGSTWPSSIALELVIGFNKA